MTLGRNDIITFYSGWGGKHNLKRSKKGNLYQGNKRLTVVFKQKKHGVLGIVYEKGASDRFIGCFYLSVPDLQDLIKTAQRGEIDFRK